MKWYGSRYAYPLIIGSLLLSISLQGVWLRQLFLSQRGELAKELEAVVSRAASQTSFVSLTPGRDPGSQVREFFLSPQWLKMRQAFDDLKQKGLQSNFHYTVGRDSSSVEMRIVFSNQVPLVQEPSVAVKWNSESPEELQKVEKGDIREMDSLVRSELAVLGVRQKTDYALYDYGNDTLNFLTMPLLSYRAAAYRSARYSFNFKSLHKYQLIVDELSTVVLFRMRYYLLSSLLMVLLTGVAFYFLLRLIRNQRLYADARIAFTSNMTHELKTPVATIAVALESITRYQLIHEPEKLQNYLDISRHELQRLNLMIEKVLNLSREKEIGHPLHQELYDVQAGLQQAISSMQIQLDNSRSVIRYDGSPEPCFVSGDPIHLVNVFYNLIDNAIKYAGPGLELQISCHGHQGHITVSFKDNGPGIPRDYQEKIFERYFRVPSGGDIHNTKGSGLGLHYVRQIIEGHGGQVALKPGPGKGSNFIIILPAAL
ncbi:MAG TPA: HAMP domain-containing sensor histidine kinase [Puia sp.]|nr:HAMP domain-containing sensor histidine kinase [Puia sp.]